MEAHQHSPDSSSEECTVLEAPPDKNSCPQHAGKVRTSSSPSHFCHNQMTEPKRSTISRTEHLPTCFVFSYRWQICSVHHVRVHCVRTVSQNMMDIPQCLWAQPWSSSAVASRKGLVSSRAGTLPFHCVAMC